LSEAVTVREQAAGQLDGGAVVGIAVSQVDAAGALVGCLQVGRRALLVEDRVMGVEQGGAGALALPVGAHGEDGQVVVRQAGQVVGVQLRVEDGEPLRPPAGDLGQVLVVSVGRAGGLWSEGDPQGGGVAAGGGVHEPVGQRVLDVHAEVAGEDLAAGGLIADQPLARRDGEERISDDLAEHADVGLAGADDADGCGTRRLSARGHEHPLITVLAWALTAWAPSPMAS
jgi:hypothetical protein